MEDKLRRIVADVLEIDEGKVGDDTSPDNEANWDSLRHMNLIFAIEGTFGVRFSDDQMSSLTSVGKIREALSRNG